MTKEVTLTIRGQAVIARFPNIGQTLQIEQMKQILTDGRYAVMAFSGLKTSNEMLDLVDAICYLSSVIDDFYKKLGIKTYVDILNMDLDDGIPSELKKQYSEIYEPFFNSRYVRSDRPIKQASNVEELNPEDVEEDNEGVAKE